MKSTDDAIDWDSLSNEFAYIPSQFAATSATLQERGMAAPVPRVEQASKTPMKCVPQQQASQHKQHPQYVLQQQRQNQLQPRQPPSVEEEPVQNKRTRDTTGGNGVVPGDRLHLLEAENTAWLKKQKTMHEDQVRIDAQASALQSRREDMLSFLSDSVKTQQAVIASLHREHSLLVAQHRAELTDTDAQHCKSMEAMRAEIGVLKQRITDADARDTKLQEELAREPAEPATGPGRRTMALRCAFKDADCKQIKILVRHAPDTSDAMHQRYERGEEDDVSEERYRAIWIVSIMVTLPLSMLLATLVTPLFFTVVALPEEARVQCWHGEPYNVTERQPYHLGVVFFKSHYVAPQSRYRLYKTIQVTVTYLLRQIECQGRQGKVSILSIEDALSQPSDGEVTTALAAIRAKRWINETRWLYSWCDSEARCLYTEPYDEGFIYQRFLRWTAWITVVAVVIPMAQLALMLSGWLERQDRALTLYRAIVTRVAQATNDRRLQRDSAV